MTDPSVTYDATADLYTTHFSLDDPESVADAIVFAVSDITDTDPIDLEPLGHVVDTDALAAVFQPASGTSENVAVAFEYAGFEVTVAADETIQLNALT